MKAQLTLTAGYTLYPDVLPLLKQLRANGDKHQQDAGRVVIGIITNSDNRTADILTSMGVRVNPLHYGDPPNHSSTAQNAEAEAPFDIDFTVLSYDVGFEKPDRRIFAAAEEMLASHVEAEQQQVVSDEWSKIYVGDEYEKDVVGATEAGWKAVLIDRETAGECEGVEWLHRDEPASVLAVLARTKAVGFGSLKQFGEWM
jgi:FMN phosphatase YigB (HAD superfamily)